MLHQQAESCLLFTVCCAQGQQARLEALRPRDSKMKIIASQVFFFFSKKFPLQVYRNNGNSETLVSWAPKSLWMVTAAMKLKDAYSLEEKQ